jgi:xanthine dehydrogenase accessory factor
MSFFAEICFALRDDKVARLATIISTSGSTPAPAHSRMLVRTVGKLRTIGTVGGGCLDLSILTRIEDDPTGEIPQIISFELNDDVGDTGLMCGGTATVLLERLDESMLPVFENILQALNLGADCILVHTLSKSGGAKKTLLTVEGRFLSGEVLSGKMLALVRDSIRDILQTGKTSRMQAEDQEYIIELLRADPPLIIFGGGHVGKAVSQCAALAGFRVTVVDDRPEFAGTERFPEADRVICARFDQALSEIALTPATYIVIVTRGHHHDENVLEQCLQHDLKYMGMIGSKRKVHVTFQHLAERGISRERLSQVHAPVGLKIGAKTPGEIAVSIVAEMIEVRRRSASSALSF